MDEYDLTTRQREILEQLCKGYSNKVIARNLGIAESTVKLHLTDVFKAMGVSTRYQALAIACSLPVTKEPKMRELSDLEILEEFTDLAFTVGDEKWSKRVILFGHAIGERAKT